MYKVLKSKKLNSGFSLVELIVVILIMGILAVAIAPSVMRYIAVAQKNVCDNSIAEIENCYKREQAAQNKITLKEVIKDKNKEFFSNKPECPTSGTYVAVLAEDGTKNLIVVCTEHSDGVHKVNAQTTYILEKLMSMTAKERQEYLGITNNNVSNDTIRPKILEALGGKYEPMTPTMKSKMSNMNKKKDLYVKPMITHDWEVGTGRTEYVLYANEQVDDSGKNLWIANAVFDPKTGKWYEYVNSEKKTYGLANQKYENIMNEILIEHPNDWNALN